MASKARRAIIGACLMALLVGMASAQPADPADLHQRANQLYHEGRFSEAAELAEQALALSEARDGPDNPNTALRLYLLGQIHLAQGLLLDAESRLTRALAIFELTLPADSWEVLDTLHMLALLYYGSAREAEAEPLYRRALATAERNTQRYSRKFEHEALIGLGTLYIGLGRHGEAEPLLRRALDMQEGQRDDRELAVSLTSLIILYQSQRRYAEAEPLLLRALPVLERVRDPGHRDVSGLFRRLAENYRGQRRDAEAAQVLAWVFVKDSTDPGVVERFLADHPVGPFTDRARQLLAGLRPSPQPAPGAVPVDVAPGQPFRDCAVCPELVMVPPGSYRMGSSDADLRSWARTGIPPGRFAAESPQHAVTIDYPLAVGRYEVTFDEWDACVAAQWCKHRPRDRWGRGRQPVTSVSWIDVREYLAWLARETGARYRLPSEAEWEYAARAGTTTAFHFGPAITTDQANYDGRRNTALGPPGEDRDRTVRVGSFPANAFGLHDVHGNAREWVEDCWHETYEGAPANGSAWGACDKRVTRGGAYSDSAWRIRSASRLGVAAETRRSAIGFRVVRDVR